MRLGDTDFALEMAWRSVALAPDKPAARFRLAAILRRAGQHEAAAAATLRGQELAALR